MFCKINTFKIYNSHNKYYSFGSNTQIILFSTAVNSYTSSMGELYYIKLFLSAVPLSALLSPVLSVSSLPSSLFTNEIRGYVCVKHTSL